VLWGKGLAGCFLVPVKIGRSVLGLCCLGEEKKEYLHDSKLNCIMVMKKGDVYEKNARNEWMKHMYARNQHWCECVCGRMESLG